MIDETLFPDLTSERSRRATGVLLARQVAGEVAATSLVAAFLRIVDGAILDYELARAAYYAFWRDPKLGIETPISARLVPYAHHIENCVTNLLRALLLCDRVRCAPARPGSSPLVEKVDWKALNVITGRVRDFRNAIQHADEQLQAGVLPAAIHFDDSGKVTLGGHALGLAELAGALRDLGAVAWNVVGRLPTP